MKQKLMLAGCAAIAMSLSVMAERIVYDFETGDLQGWQVTKGAFARPVTDLAKEHNTGKPYTKGGTYFVSTLENADNRPNDGQTGLIESQTIRLTGPTITFKIGGGRHASFELVDRATGKVLVSAVGENGERMRSARACVARRTSRRVRVRRPSPCMAKARTAWRRWTSPGARTARRCGSSSARRRRPRPAGASS